MLNHRLRTMVRVASGSNVLLGLLLLASPWIFGFFSGRHECCPQQRGGRFTCRDMRHGTRLGIK